jgi:hypothetical protein
MRPTLHLTLIDPSRMGGSQAPHRHAFAAAPRQTPVPSAPAAHRAALSQAAPVPNGLVLDVSESERASIRDAAATVVEALRLEIDVVGSELETVTPEALRATPDLRIGIPIVGMLPPPEIRTQITIDARRIDALAQRLLTGAAAPYLRPEQADALDAVHDSARAILAQAQQYDLAPIKDEDIQLSAEHADTHVGDIAAAINEVERLIVTAEAPSVPVREPAEKGAAIGTIVGLGIIAAVAWVIIDSL